MFPRGPSGNPENVRSHMLSVFLPQATRTHDKAAVALKLSVVGADGFLAQEAFIENCNIAAYLEHSAAQRRTQKYSQHAAEAIWQSCRGITSHGDMST